MTLIICVSTLSFSMLWTTNLVLEFKCSNSHYTIIIVYTVSTNKERRKSVLKLGERMVTNYILGVSGTTTHHWTTFSGSDHNINDVRVMTRQSIHDPGRPRGIVLSASTSIWLPSPPKTVFDFLRDENTRGKVPLILLRKNYNIHTFTSHKIFLCNLFNLCYNFMELSNFFI